MKKLSVLLGTLILMIAIGFQSCGGGGLNANSPGATVKKSIKLLAEKKYEKVVEMYTKKDGTVFTEEEKGKVLGLMTMAGADLVKKNGLKSVEIIEEKVAEDGKTAHVIWKITYGDGKSKDESSDLMQVGNDWKIVIGN